MAKKLTSQEIDVNSLATSFIPTLLNGAILRNGEIVKRGNMVSVNLVMNLSNIGSTFPMVVANIPIGLRPATTVYGCLTLNGSPSIYCHIDKDGQFVFEWSVSKSNVAQVIITYYI